MNISTLLRAGAVRRFHVMPTIRENTVAEHSWQVVVLVLMLTEWTASASLLQMAALHDCAEFETGDIPSPAKRLFGIKDTVSAAEKTVMEAHGIPHFELSEANERIIKLADCLSGMMNCITERSLGNRNVTGCFANYLMYIRALGPLTEAQNNIVDEVVALWKEYLS